MQDSNTILGFDFGEKRLGIARVDTEVKLPQPVTTIEPDDSDKLKELIDELRPSALVVGLPRGLDGQETKQTQVVREFAAGLDSFGLPVVLQDEALTSETAKQRPDGKTSVDELAACIILEDYLRENS